jgi:TM2 domain-containing membrane protein YozV
MEYFEVPEARPGQDGLCSDNDCPCGYPGARIPRGTGYIYISKAVVDFRRDARTVREAEMKMELMRKRMNAVIMFDQNTVSSTLMCEQGARKRGLDLAVAAADARYWWETGLVPLRETPLAGSSAVKVVVQQPVQFTPSQPIIKAYEPVTGKKSPILAAALSLLLFGGAGQIYLGQWKKGLTLILATLLLSSLFIGIPIGIIGVGDAYGTAKKLRDGDAVEEWKFNIDWKVTGLVAIIYAVAICGIVFLVSLSPSR